MLHSEVGMVQSESGASKEGAKKVWQLGKCSVCKEMWPMDDLTPSLLHDSESRKPGAAKLLICPVCKAKIEDRSARVKQEVGSGGDVYVQ